MANDSLISVQPLSIVPTEAGCAIFLGNDDKAIVFYGDPAVGMSINTVLTGQKPPRPLTHDLFNGALRALGGRVREMVIARVDGDVFYAQLVLEVENELSEKKIVQLDARPSDAIAMAVRDEAPIFIRLSVWHVLPDMTDLLERLKKADGGI